VYFNLHILDNNNNKNNNNSKTKENILNQNSIAYNEFHLFVMSL